MCVCVCAVSVYVCVYVYVRESVCEFVYDCLMCILVDKL